MNKKLLSLIQHIDDPVKINTPNSYFQSNPPQEILAHSNPLSYQSITLDYLPSCIGLYERGWSWLRTCMRGGGR